jgi:putative ABC transport system ATP-binding protein
MASVLETSSLKKIYKMGDAEVAALDGVSVSIEKGSFVAIQGTSGSGKSTLLNMMGALDHPSSGEVFFESRPLSPLGKSALAKYRRFSVGMIFQNFNLIPTMTAAENVSLALAFGGVTRKQRAEKTRRLLERVGLGARLQHKPSELSGGEQQRVAIARALANSPRVLLADEPTGNLDSTRAEEVLTLLKEMVRRDDLTVVMVTHDREIAAHFADSIIMMKDGRVVS